MASQEWEKLRKVLKPGLAVADDPTPLVREKMEAVHPTHVPDDVELEYVEMAGTRCAWVAAPEAAGGERVVFFVHGGAFVSTYLKHYIAYVSAQSRFARARVLIHEYSLAPEARFPVQLDETVAVYRALLDQGTAPDRIAFMGDSCGGGIALAALCKLRDEGAPLPACYAGLTPWFDLEQEGDAAVNPRGVDPYVNRDWIRARFRDYIGDAGDPKDPLASPILADLTGLPPLFLSVGQIDTTSDDSTRLAARAGKAGVDVTLEVNAGMIHGFHGLSSLFPESRRSCERVGAFVQHQIPDPGA